MTVFTLKREEKSNYSSWSNCHLNVDILAVVSVIMETRGARLQL